LRLAAVPAAQLALPVARRPACGSAADDPDPRPFALQIARVEREFFWRVDRPHGLRPAVRYLPAAQLLWCPAWRSLRVGPDRWRRAGHDVLQARASPVRAGAGLARHLPVSVDLERPAGGAGLPGQCSA